MYNLLIVDDEPIIVEGLFQLFSEIDMELELYFAYSAKEALDRALQTKVDIVISDMRMPGKNGLQFIDEFQLLWPKCRIIFLSGYDQFDYVYDATKRNIDSYVLKTEDDQVLIDAVQKSIQKIEEERSIQVRLEMNRRKIEEAEPLVKREFLKLLLNGSDMNGLKQSFSLTKASFEIDLDDQWLVVAGQLEYDRGSIFRDLLLLHEMIKQELHPNLHVEFCVYDQQLAVWFIQPKKNYGIFFENETIKWDSMKEYCKRFLESIQEIYIKKRNIKVNFVLGKRPVDANLINEDFQQIHDICKFISSFSKEIIIVDQSKTNPFYHQELKTNEAQPWKKKLMTLEGIISEGEEQKAIKMIDELFDQVVNNEYSNLDITDFLFSISQLILEFLRNKELYDDIIKKQGEDFQKNIQQLPVLFDSKETILSMIKAICQYKAKWREDRKRKVIIIVNKYIQDHIAGDLSLTAIADVVHFNPSYLSRFYKEQTGRNLSDVIDELRMKKAIDFLTQTEIPINEIANKLGFNSPSYFTLYFKKRVNQSPQEYRENRRT